MKVYIDLTDNMTDIAEATAQRLRAFSDDLDPRTVDYVASAMARHVGDLALASASLSDNLITIPHEGLVPLHVLDMAPHHGSRNERSAVVAGLMWGQGLTPQVVRRMKLLHDCMPNDRIIAVATPAGSASRWGSLAPAQRTALSGGDFSPLADPLLEYLHNTGVRNVDLVGTSFGADEIAAAAARAADHGMAVNRVVAIEPTSVLSRRVGRLVLDFCATRHSIARHVGISGNSSYDKLQQAEFAISSLLTLAVNSLLRPTSRAAAQYLAGGQFGKQLAAALDSQEGMNVQIVWGTHSGLAPYEHTQRLAGTLRERYGERVSVLWMSGLGHGLCSDVALTTLLTLQGLGRTAAA